MRLQVVMTELHKFILTNDDGTFGRFTFLMQSLTDEIIEELTDKDEALIGAFLGQMGEVIAWIGHGDNERLPETLRVFAEEIQPSDSGTHLVSNP